MLRLVLVLLLLSCSACKKTEASARAFAACLDAPVPDARRWSVGALSLESKERVLTIKRASDVEPVVAVARGPAPFESSLRVSRECIDAAEVDVLILLGDYGDRPAALDANLQRLRRDDRVIVLLPGGRDAPDVLARALDEHQYANVVDASPYERVDIGSQRFVPVAGAPDGYRTTTGACGFDAAGLASRLRQAELGASPPVLLTWAAPETDGVGMLPGPSGHRALRELASRLGSRSVLSAFPSVQAGRRVQDVVVVPPIGGARPSRADGAYAARGFALVGAGIEPDLRACP